MSRLSKNIILVILSTSFLSSIFLSSQAQASVNEEVYTFLKTILPEVKNSNAELRRGSCIVRELYLKESSGLDMLNSLEIEKIKNLEISLPVDSIDGVNILLNCQYGYYQKNGEILKIFIISTGRRGLETKNGVFTVHYQYNGWWESTLYPGSWLYRPKYFYRGMALHGLKSDLGVKAYPDSHGCVRLERRYMDYLWKVMNKNTRVSVRGIYS